MALFFMTSNLNLISVFQFTSILFNSISANDDDQEEENFAAVSIRLITPSDNAKGANKEFLPRCFAFSNAVSMESFKNLKYNAMHAGKKLQTAIFSVLVDLLS